MPPSDGHARHLPTTVLAPCVTLCDNKIKASGTRRCGTDQLHCKLFCFIMSLPAGWSSLGSTSDSKTAAGSTGCHMLVATACYRQVAATDPKQQAKRQPALNAAWLHGCWLPCLLRRVLRWQAQHSSAQGVLATCRPALHDANIISIGSCCCALQGARWTQP